MLCAITCNAFNMPPGSRYVCALRGSDRAPVWRFVLPSFFIGTILAL